MATSSSRAVGHPGLRALTSLVLLGASLVPVAACTAPPGTPGRVGGASTSAAGPALGRRAARSTSVLCHLPPVDGPVVDGFRPPDHPWGAGNRGLTYATRPGSAVRATAPGVVRFAGRIGPHAYVSVVHADGLRTTYSYLASIGVHGGQVLAGRARLGTTGRTFHLGILEGATYLDPATVLGRGCPRRHAVLVPLGG
jgi:murein DD-endopeptidase MepM/ murein hydrolase activator NlpD